MDSGIEIEEIARRLVSEGASSGLGFDRVMAIRGSSYRDCSTIIIMPTVDPMIDFRIVAALQSLIAPMNQRRMMLFCVGDEVGHAYNNLVSVILGHADMSTYKYVMTIESDNLPPPDAQIRLLETIESGGWDAVSGLYFTKGEINMPMAFGDPKKFELTGELDFAPRDVASALSSGSTMPVNGIAMGCALWRLDLFRQLQPPWFVTVADVVDGGHAEAFTQDLYFCREARRQGKRFAVDCRVKVGHMDIKTGVVY